MPANSKNDFLLTKIISTLGPASSSVELIIKLIDNGVRVFRINFSHGSFKDYKNLLKNIRTAEKKCDVHIAVLGDLSGPKIRLGKVIEGGIELKIGQEIQFVKKEIIGGSKKYENIFNSTFPQFIDEVKLGERILIDDGNIELKCIGHKGINPEISLICQVVIGGKVSTAKGINLPDSDLKSPSMTEKDFKCTKFAVENNFDYLALSFVRTASDVKMLKDELIRLNARPKENIETKGNLGFTVVSEGLKNYIPIISKIEKPQAIDNLASIIRETDGIMVARGDLGVEMDIAQIAVLQKRIVQMCHEHGRPVIVATQMLESMINSPVPTRAEVSDVANAIFDGVDAVMLSGETAVGKYPVQTVQMMKRVALNTNKFIMENKLQSITRIKPLQMNRSAVLAEGVKAIVEGIDPKFLVVWSNWGGQAVRLSQLRTTIPIIACNANQQRLRQLSLLYSITPINMKQPKSGSAFIKSIDKMILANEWAKKGDAIVIVSPDPINKLNFSNRIVIHYLGESIDN